MQEKASAAASHETTPLLQAEKEKTKLKKKEPSLVRVLIRTFGLTLLKSHLCKFTYDILQFASPLLLK